MQKVKSYDEKKYIQKNDIYSCIYQIYQDIRNEMNSGTGWNRLVYDMEGFTMRMVDDRIDMFFMYQEVLTPEMLAMLEKRDDEEKGKVFLKKVEKEIKDRFKKMHGKTLKLKIKDKDVGYEKTSQLYADESWVLSAPFARTGRPVGRYLIRHRWSYDFDVE